MASPRLQVWISSASGASCSKNLPRQFVVRVLPSDASLSDPAVRHQIKAQRIRIDPSMAFNERPACEIGSHSRALVMDTTLSVGQGIS
jgi:hypothetical protein